MIILDNDNHSGNGNDCEKWERLRERLWKIYFYKPLINSFDKDIFVASKQKMDTGKPPFDNANIIVNRSNNSKHGNTQFKQHEGKSSFY